MILILVAGLCVAWWLIQCGNFLIVLVEWTIAYWREVRQRGGSADGCFAGCDWPRERCRCGVARFGQPRGR